MSELTIDALSAGVSTIQAEGGGMLTVVVAHPSEGPVLAAMARAGSREALQLFRSVVQTLEAIAKAPKRKPLLCATCPRPLRKAVGFSIAMALPATGNPSLGLCLAVCARCAPEDKPDAIMAKATQAFGAIWPKARPVTLTHKTGGRA